MEDEPEKLRRNLIFVAALILAYQWLGLGNPDSILGFPMKSKSIVRIWAALHVH